MTLEATLKMLGALSIGSAILFVSERMRGPYHHPRLPIQRVDKSYSLYEATDIRGTSIIAYIASFSNTASLSSRKVISPPAEYESPLLVFFSLPTFP